MAAGLRLHACRAINAGRAQLGCETSCDAGLPGSRDGAAHAREVQNILYHTMRPHAIPCDPTQAHATLCDLVRSAHMPEKQNMPICDVTWLQSRVLPAAVRALLSAARMAMMRSAIWLHSARHCASSLASPSTWLALGVELGIGVGVKLGLGVEARVGRVVVG